MRKSLFILAFISMAVFGFCEKNITLKAAITEGVTEISTKLPEHTKVVVLNFKSVSSKMSDYVIEEITGELVNNGSLDVLDRKNLVLLQQEMSFQQSGEVSDDSAQAIGKKLGAQSIISGTIEKVNDYYRFRVQVIQVETAKIQILKSYNVAVDKTTEALMGTVTSQTVSPVETPLTAGNFYDGKMAGEMLAKGSGGWFFSGFCLGAVGILIPYIVEPNVPTANLMGKSIEYIQGYNEGYKKEAKSKNVKAAAWGCGTQACVGTVGYLVYVSLLVSAASASTY